MTGHIALVSSSLRTNHLECSKDEAKLWVNEAKSVGEMPHRQSEITPVGLGWQCGWQCDSVGGTILWKSGASPDQGLPSLFSCHLLTKQIGRHWITTTSRKRFAIL